MQSKYLNRNYIKTSWDDVINNKNSNDPYSYFIHKLIVLYGKYFPKQNIRPKLASEIEKTAKTFDVYLKKVDILQPEYPLTVLELKEA